MAILGGGSLNSVPSPVKSTTTGNFLDIRNNGWTEQYLPDLMESEAEVFGNRTISGFLSQVGAEEAMASDQVIWSEQGRLHLSYNADHDAATDGLFTIDKDADGLDTTGAVRVGDTVVVSTTGATMKCYVAGSYNDGTAGLTAGQIQVYPYTAATMAPTIALGAADVKLFVYGSEYGKGTPGRGASVEPSFQSFTNKPIILKDLYTVSGSDASAIGWVEVSGEDGQNGYLWYLKAQGDTTARFADYCEMALIEGELKDAGANSEVPEGTEGLFAAVTSRGNITDGLDAAGSILSEFDLILAEFDKQGAIEENMMFLDRATALKIDDMLASMNSYGGGGTSYGVFNNSEDMALNLGFSGFRRGSYDFYKSDWKYLNDKTTRGSVIDETVAVADGLGDIRGVIVPAGVSSVYDQMLGKNLKRPFLHVRYRASQTESRKMKNWVTGSVGAVTSDLDAMEVHYLSERCLVTQGANNFMLIKG